jgi:hypothetical protein
VGYDGEEQHLAHGQATTVAPHLGDARVAGMPSTGDGGRDPIVDAEKKSRGPSKVELEQIEQHKGELN